MIETLRALMISKNTLKLTQEDSGRALIIGIPIHTLGGDRIQMNDKVYDSTPEENKASPYTSYTGKTMKYEYDILMTNNIIRDLVYTGIGDRQSNRKTFFTKTLPHLVKKNQNKNF